MTTILQMPKPTHASVIQEHPDSPAVMEAHFGNYEQAIREVRRRTQDGSYNGCHFTIMDHGEPVLEVWQDSGRWVDRGKYA